MNLIRIKMKLNGNTTDLIEITGINLNGNHGQMWNHADILGDEHIATSIETPIVH